MREMNRADSGRFREQCSRRLLTFDELFARQVLQQFSEWFAQCQQLAEICWGEIGSSCGCAGTFPTDLNDSDHFAAGKNWRAHNFLNSLTGRARRGLYTLEHGGVTRVRKAIVDFRPALSGGARGQCRIARERNEAHILQGLGGQEVQMPP